MYYLSIDVGTSSVKTAIIDEKKAILQQAKATYAYEMFPGERVELKEEDLLSALKTAVQQLNEAYRKKVDCLCYDTFSPSPVTLDKNGRLLGHAVITHLDRRSRSYSATIDNIIGNHNYMQIAGILPFPGGCSLMTFLWLKDHEPDRMKETYRIGHLPTYLHYFFTGQWAVDRVNASMMGMYDTVRDNGWSEDILRAFGVDKRLLPDVVQPGEYGGVLLPETAAVLGVPQGIPVSYGTNDMAASQTGAGNRKSGDILNSAGSSDMVSILTDQPLTFIDCYLRCAADPGLWQLYSTTVGGFAVDWFRQQFCRDLNDDRVFHQWLADSIKKYTGKTEVVFDPYLAGDRQSLEKKTAAWHGLTLSTSREEMAVAMLEAIQKVLLHTVTLAANNIQLSGQIKLTGGMLSPAYLEMKRQVFDAFDIHRVDHAPVLGNVSLAEKYMINL